ncbi:MAG: PAS domain S-box protein, partial [Sandaracinaceae bacterium]|nr:PAS domain S-box protein [Sandaracinaceae bacterium]
FAPIAVIDDLQALSHLPGQSRYKQVDARSVALVVLRAGGSVVGLLSAYTFGERRGFSTDDRQWLQAIGDLLSQTLRAYHDTRSALSSLRKSEEKYRRIVTTIADGVWSIDVEGRTSFANEQMAQMLGYEPDEMIGRSLFDFMDEEAGHQAAANLERRRRGIRERHEFRLRKKDGTDLWTVMTSSPLTDDAGRYAGALAVVTDLTERRSLELRIQQAQKLESLGVLAGGIAHDFNNLLVGILGNVGIANLDLPPESPVAPVLADIQTAALRAADLTKQLLAYAGKGRFVVERLDLNRLVSEMTHLLTTVVSKKAALRLDLAPSLPPVEGDATQLRQVVMNLITNASDALGDEPGIISITTGVVQADREYLQGTYLDDRLEEGRYVFLEVADNGSGMDQPTRERIFDPFFSTKFTGRGLGLAAVLGILRSHGGAVKVYSEPGRGSSFKVLLPAVAGAAEPGVEERDAGPEGASRGVVLVVDDEDSVRSVARRVLERAGFDVIDACDGHEAVDVFRERADEIAVVLLDMTMPRLSGEEAFRELRRIRPGVRVVLSSGYNEQEATQRFAGKGLARFLQKPWTASALVAAMRGILERE